jgi:hypothetical protein
MGNKKASGLEVVPVAVEFNGAQLLTTVVGDQVFVAMKSVTEGMGLDWGSQCKKIKDDRRYSVVTIPLNTSGGIQEMVCLPVKQLHTWLFTINANRVRADLRDRVIAYQDECQQAIIDYWEKGVAVNPRMEAHRDQAPVYGSRTEGELVDMRKKKVKDALEVIDVPGRRYRQMTGILAEASPPTRDFAISEGGSDKVLEIVLEEKVDIDILRENVLGFPKLAKTNTVAEFIENECVVDKDTEGFGPYLRVRYMMACDFSGLTPLPAKEWCQQFEVLGYPVTKKHRLGSEVWVIHGVNLKSIKTYESALKRAGVTLESELYEGQPERESLH